MNKIYRNSKDNLIENNKKRSILAVLIAVLCLTCMILSDVPVYAGENSTIDPTGEEGIEGGAYEVTSYDLTTVVGKDHSYNVIEEITVNIPAQPKSIDFSIPSGSFRVSSVNVENTEFTTKSVSGSSMVSITDASKLTVGIHTYKITYLIREFADRDENRDILYYSVLLPEWSQPIGNLSARVIFPSDFVWDDMQCYAGQFGVQDTENRLEIIQDESENVVTITGKMIPENFGISLKAQLPDGYWEGALDGVWAVLAMLFIMGTVALVLLIMWLIGGRDPKFKKTHETRPIEGVSPLDFGYIFNSRMDIRDLVRMIMYFGMKGYLKISEYEPKRYKLYRLNDPEGEEKLFRNAYNILFEDVYKGRALDMDKIGERLVRIENAVKDDVAAGFASKEMQAYTPLSRGFRYAGIALISIGLALTNALKYSYQYVAVNYLESVLIGLAAAVLLILLSLSYDKKVSSSSSSGKTGTTLAICLLSALGMSVAYGIVRQTGQILIAVAVLALFGLSTFLIVIMRARGKGNAALVMRFRQLRKFIYHPTPKEILENHIADKNYYYDMLLYALTFGAEETWAISFLTLDVPEPEWYSDDIEGQAFSNLRERPTTIDYARDLRSFARTIEGAYQNM